MMEATGRAEVDAGRDGRATALAKPGAWADNPWDDDHGLQGRAGERGKIFAFLGGEASASRPAPTREVADEWLHRYPDGASVMAYIGRSGWNDLAFDGAIPDDELLEAVDESYRLVVAKLPKKLRPDGRTPLGGRARGAMIRRSREDQAWPSRFR